MARASRCKIHFGGAPAIVVVVVVVMVVVVVRKIVIAVGNKTSTMLLLLAARLVSIFNLGNIERRRFIRRDAPEARERLRERE